MRKRFELIYATQIKQHLRVIEKKYHALIRQNIEEQLSYDPDVETRNRKPLHSPEVFGADWEIRFGSDNQFRVFYEIDQEHQEIHILAIGIKLGNRLFISGEEVKL